MIWRVVIGPLGMGSKVSSGVGIVGSGANWSILLTRTNLCLRLSYLTLVTLYVSKTLGDSWVTGTE